MSKVRLAEDVEVRYDKYQDELCGVIMKGTFVQLDRDKTRMLKYHPETYINNQDFVERLYTLTMENEKLKSESDETNKQLECALSKIDTLEKELDNLRPVSIGGASSIPYEDPVQSSISMDELKKENNELEKMEAKLNMNNKELEKTVAKLKEENDRMKKENEDSKKMVTELKNELTFAENDSKNTFTFASDENSKSDADNRMKDLELQLTTALSENKGLNELLDEYSRKVDDLTTQLEITDADDCNGDDTVINSLKTEISRLQKQLSEQEEKYSSLVKNWNIEIQGEREGRKKLERKILTLKKENSNLKKIMEDGVNRMAFE